MTQREHLDVVVVGAGLSGIAAGYYLQAHCPKKRYAILEAREAIGGTWDLFRFPGVRSDSDMYTLGYTFNPWTDQRAIADGATILNYIRETAARFNIDEKIRFGQRLCRAEWSSEQAHWTIGVQRGAELIELTCNFLLLCTGYYQYDEGYTPDWPTLARFGGTVIHPQDWPEDYDYSGQRVVVIGSGATAVTVVPVMAQQAAHVTMLQRSPSYIASRPAEDKLVNGLQRVLPTRTAHRLARWKGILTSVYEYFLARRFPQTVKKSLIDQIREDLGPDVDVDKHFTPDYNPWDQRVCLTPDGDFFEAIKAGRVTMVTDHIAEFDAQGIQLQSGERLDADLIVTATGLKMKILHGVELFVDGDPVDLAEHLSYKGMMLSELPNMASILGYTNASWTLKAELSAEYVCRLLNHMDAEGYDSVTARLDAAQSETMPVVNFTSGYVQRALDTLPKQGTEHPWKLYQNYLLDLRAMRFSPLEDGALTFSRAVASEPAAKTADPVPAAGD